MFQGINLQEVCNIIILVSAVIIAVKNIYGFLKKPVDDLHSHTKKAEEKRIEEVIEARVPDLLQKHGDSVKEERKKETEAMMESLKVAVVNALEDKVEELKEITLDQGVQITSIKASIEKLNDAQMDIMRYDMNRIYYKYRPYKKILDCDKKAFLKFYQDYHGMGGNTWIDGLYNEVKDWEIVKDERELES